MKRIENRQASPHSRWFPTTAASRKAANWRRFTNTRTRPILAPATAIFFRQVLKTFLLSLVALSCSAQDLATVISKPISKTIELPGEIHPFLSVSLHAKVAGYVERVLVDRGTFVKPGDLLIELSAPELKSQIAESQSRVQAAESDRLQAVAQLEAARATADRLKEASKTEGAIAGNEI